MYDIMHIAAAIRLLCSIMIHFVRYIVNGFGGDMLDKLNFIFAENLKRVREAKKLSLDHLSKLSGVSKSMLGQIERGEVNPTISTVWKISNGLKVSFTSLMSRPEADIEVVRIEHVEPLLDDQGRSRNYPVFPFDESRRFEMYLLEIEQGGKISAEAHPQGTQEFITVFSGELTILIHEQEYIVKSGDSIRFRADTAHCYFNHGNELVKVSMVIHYPQ